MNPSDKVWFRCASLGKKPFQKYDTIRPTFSLRLKSPKKTLLKKSSEIRDLQMMETRWWKWWKHFYDFHHIQKHFLNFKLFNTSQFFTAKHSRNFVTRVHHSKKLSHKCWPLLTGRVENTGATHPCYSSDPSFLKPGMYMETLPKLKQHMAKIR